MQLVPTKIYRMENSFDGRFRRITIKNVYKQRTLRLLAHVFIDIIINEYLIVRKQTGKFYYLRHGGHSLFQHVVEIKRYTCVNLLLRCTVDALR